MGNVTNTLDASIQVTDDINQAQILNRVITGTSYDSSVALGIIALALAAGMNSIQLPKALCYQLYVRNTDPSNWIDLFLTTPQSALVGGGTGKIEVGQLYPGDVFIFWQNPSTKNPEAGFSTLDLFGQNANTLCEYFIGA
jgi:hypothetical protein